MKNFKSALFLCVIALLALSTEACLRVRIQFRMDGYMRGTFVDNGETVCTIDQPSGSVLWQYSFEEYLLTVMECEGYSPYRTGGIFKWTDNKIPDDDRYWALYMVEGHSNSFALEHSTDVLFGDNRGFRDPLHFLEADNWGC